MKLNFPNHLLPHLEEMTSSHTVHHTSSSPLQFYRGARFTAAHARSFASTDGADIAGTIVRCNLRIQETLPPQGLRRPLQDPPLSRKKPFSKASIFMTNNVILITISFAQESYKSYEMFFWLSNTVSCSEKSPVRTKSEAKRPRYYIKGKIKYVAFFAV